MFVDNSSYLYSLLFYGNLLKLSILLLSYADLVKVRLRLTFSVFLNPNDPDLYKLDTGNYLVLSYILPMLYLFIEMQCHKKTMKLF